MNIGIIGLGLIGGSLGRAIKKRTAHTVYGADTDGNAVLKAKLLRAIDGELDENSLRTVDLLIVALTPAAAISELARALPFLKPNATVIDCAGNKREIYAAMEKLYSEYNEIAFAAVHPMAGREFSGISHSSVNLFDNAYFIVVPVHTPIDKLTVLKELFIAIGAAGIVMSNAAEHDRIIAYTSQLAHIVSGAYIKSPTASDFAGYSAGSFRDMTRVAKLNPAMWAELMMKNADFLLPEIETLIDNLKEYAEALKNNDTSELYALLDDGSKRKELADARAREKRKC